MSVGSRRHTRTQPCPICDGHPDLQRGQGARCTGFRSDDGKWAHCSREEFAGRAKFHDGSSTWSHAIGGKCPCGVSHGPETEDWQPPPAHSSPREPAKVRQIGSSSRAPIVATYDYHAVDGTLLYQVCRTEPKSFLQRRPKTDGTEGWLWTMQGQPTTLYRLPELIPGLDAGDTVYIAEGEKDVEAIRAAGQVATCNTGGAGKWRDDLSAAFVHAQAGAKIIIIQDRDDPGHKGISGQEHAQQVYKSLGKVLPAGVDVSIAEATVGKDAADHLEAGRSLEDFDQVWPIPDDLIERDPQAFKRYMLRRALERPKTVLSFVEDDPEERALERHQPIYKSGLIASPLYTDWRGCVAISGEPSAGKSYVAISTAVDAALAGWDVFYLSAEMHQDIIRDRAARAVASAGMSDFDWRSPAKRTIAITRAKRVSLPERWHHIDVGIGVTVEMIVDMLAEQVTHRPTLVVFDSLSSFVDSMANESTGDAFGMGDLRHVTRWLVGTRKITHGHLAFVLLSELNKEGRAKGRFLDHRCDSAISMRSDPDQSLVKELAITKNWWGPTGSLGNFTLDWEMGRLVHIGDDA